MPYVHQIYDTPAWFHGGWACGPTSVVMALAYYGRLSGDYGWHVPNEYTHRSACSGEHTFSRAIHDPWQNLAQGAYGACTEEVWDPADQRWEAYAVAWRMYEYAVKHDVGYYYDGSPTETEVQAELRGGSLVTLATDLTASGHIVVVRGYTNDSPTRYIVNDPAGDWHAGYYNDHGAGAQYTWAEMSPNWYIALYGPEYLPDLSRPAYSVDGSTIVVHNGAQGAGWNASVKVCLMNSNGTLNRTVQNTSIPPHGTWSFSLYNVLGWYENFSGSATVMISQTAGSVLVRNKRYSELTLYNGLRASGGSPGWEQVGTQLYAPIAKNDWAGRYSKLRVLNTGSGATTVQVEYYHHDSGQSQGSDSLTLGPNQRGTFYASSECDPGQYCTAAITSNNGQPLAALVCEYDSGGGAPATYNASSAGNTSGYVPMVKKNHNGQSTGISVMNTSSNDADVTVTYYDMDGSGSYTAPTIENLPPKAVTVLYNPPGLPYSLSSAVIRATRPVVVLVHESGSGLYKASNGFAGGRGEAYAPEVFNTGVKGGITIQNLDGGQTGRVRVHYYDAGGALVETTGWRSILPGRAYSFHSWNGGLPDDFHGSAWVESEYGREIGVIVNEIRTGSGDTQATYNGSQP